MNIEIMVLILIVTLILLWVFRRAVIQVLSDIVEVFVDILSAIFKGLD